MPRAEVAKDRIDFNKLLIFYHKLDYLFMYFDPAVEV